MTPPPTVPTILMRPRFPQELGILFALAGLAVFFEVSGWILVGQSFIFNGQRLFISILQMATIGIVAIGVTPIIIMGGIDLSGGSIVGFAGMVCASLAQTTGAPVYPSLTNLPVVIPVLGGLITGAALGWTNGALIALTRIPPFIGTLGMLVMARGLARWYTSGKQVSFFTKGFALFGEGAEPLWIFVAVAILFHVLLTRTIYGRRTYAIGSNESAARMAGIAVGRHKMLVYGLAGLLYGLAAIVQVSRAQTAQSSTGLTWELDAISAAVIGGASLFGGIGRITGTIVGVLILGVITSGFEFLSIDVYYVAIVKGVIIVAAVVADRYRQSRRRRHE